MRRIPFLLPALVLVLVMGLVACGGDDSDDDAAADDTTTSAAADDSTTTSADDSTTTTGDAAAGGIELAATVQLAETTLGPVLINEDGRTVYLFTNDTGQESTCTDSCAENWPPLMAGPDAPTAGDGVDESLLGTTERPDGSTQITYNGHPLYLFSGDSEAGDTNGQGVGDVWFAVTAEGEAVSA